MARRGRLLAVQEELLRRETVRGLCMSAAELCPGVCGAGGAAVLVTGPDGQSLQLRGRDGEKESVVWEGIAHACLDRARRVIDDVMQRDNAGPYGHERRALGYQGWDKESGGADGGDNHS